MLVNWFFLANEVVFNSEYMYSVKAEFLLTFSSMIGFSYFSVVFTEFLKYGEKGWGVSLSPIPIKEIGPIKVSTKIKTPVLSYFIKGIHVTCGNC